MGEDWYSKQMESKYFAIMGHLRKQGRIIMQPQVENPEYDPDKKEQEYKSQKRALTYLMKEAVRDMCFCFEAFIKSGNFNDCAPRLFRLMEQYEKDFGKYKELKEKFDNFMANRSHM